MITDQHITIIRSFVIALFDKTFKERDYFLLPVSVAAPFINRIIKERLPEITKTAREPWYRLVPHYRDEGPVQRSPLPVGPTSLYGIQYNADKEPPPRVTLHPDAHIISFTVALLDFDKEILRGEFTVDDIFLAGTECLARARIKEGRMKVDEGPFYYKVGVSPIDVRTVPVDLFPPEAYKVEGVFRLPQLAKDRKRTQFRKVTPAPLPEHDPSSFGNTQTFGRGKQGNGGVLMHASVYKALREDIYLSSKNEDGGYLLGFPYRQPGSPESEDDPGFRWLLEITDVIQAEGAWGRPGLLLFTGDTWSRVNRRLDSEYPDKKLVSWFHTHLFKATDEYGLSGMDQDLHRRFLTRPWQVAVLLNIDAGGEREVRCFQRGPHGDLEECTFEVLDSKDSGEAL
jgi:hypothetical protein